MTEMVYKICTLTEWRSAVAAGSYTGSADDRRDGFIHLSTASQLTGTAQRHFAGIEGLVLLAFPADKLAPALRFEPSRGGDRFPHLYGDLDPALAMAMIALPLAAGGVPVIPTEISGAKGS